MLTVSSVPSQAAEMGRCGLCPESCKTQGHGKALHSSCSPCKVPKETLETVPREQAPFSPLRLDRPVAAHRSSGWSCFPLLPRKVSIHRTDKELHQPRHALWLPWSLSLGKNKTASVVQYIVISQTVAFLMEQLNPEVCVFSVSSSRPSKACVQ